MLRYHSLVNQTDRVMKNQILVVIMLFVAFGVKAQCECVSVGFRSKDDNRYIEDISWVYAHLPIKNVDGIHSINHYTLVKDDDVRVYLKGCFFGSSGPYGSINALTSAVQDFQDNLGDFSYTFEVQVWSDSRCGYRDYDKDLDED